MTHQLPFWVATEIRMILANWSQPNKVYVLLNAIFLPRDRRTGYCWSHIPDSVYSDTAMETLAVCFAVVLAWQAVAALSQSLLFDRHHDVCYNSSSQCSGYWYDTMRMARNHWAMKNFIAQWKFIAQWNNSYRQWSRRNFWILCAALLPACRKLPNFVRSSRLSCYGRLKMWKVRIEELG